MSLETWNKLPKQQQDMLTEVMLGLERDGLVRDRQQIEDFWKVFKDAGVEECLLPAADAEKYASFYHKGIWKQIEEKVSPEIYQKMRELSAK